VTVRCVGVALALACAAASAAAQQPLTVLHPDSLVPMVQAHTRIRADSLHHTDEEAPRTYLWRTFGPVTILRSAAVAGFEQYRGQPREWPKSRRGYVDRFSSSLGAAMMGSTLRFGLSHALDERVGQFEPCGCRGFLSRAGHAAAIPFEAYTKSGGRRFSVLTPASEIGSALLVTSVKPGGFSVRDGVRGGLIGLASMAAVSVVHEFWPWPWSLRERALARFRRRHESPPVQPLSPPRDSSARQTPSCAAGAPDSTLRSMRHSSRATSFYYAVSFWGTGPGSGCRRANR